MTHYLEIRAARIQTWLGHTSKLANRRGASNLLVAATARVTVSRTLPPGADWNPEAGDVDGVVSLVLTPQPGETVDQAATRVSRAVVGDLQAVMPTLGFEATTASADSFGEAYARLGLKAASGDFAYDAPALNTELVMAARCPECNRHPGRPTTPDDAREEEETTAPCRECRQKRVAARRRERVPDDPAAASEESPPLRATRTERALLEAYRDRARIPEDFESLARADDPRATQLALINIDGNRVGAFIGAAAAGHHGRKAELAHALTEASSAALIHAVTDGDAGMWPAIPHLVGGDDLLVSVPAECGWRVVTRFAAAFDSSLKEARDEHPDWPDTLPTVSAGLLFHHYSEPFPYALSRCEELRDEAKRSHSGAEAAVAFADLTFDGEDVRASPDARSLVHSVRWLAETQAHLDAAACTLSTAQRHSLYDLSRPRVRQRDEPPGPSPELGRKIIDQGNPALLRLLTAAGLASRRCAAVRSARPRRRPCAGCWLCCGGGGHDDRHHVPGVVLRAADLRRGARPGRHRHRSARRPDRRRRHQGRDASSRRSYRAGGLVAPDLRRTRTPGAVALERSAARDRMGTERSAPGPDRSPHRGGRDRPTGARRVRLAHFGDLHGHADRLGADVRADSSGPRRQRPGRHRFGRLVGSGVRLGPGRPTRRRRK